MENVTHSLIGVVLGEAVARTCARRGMPGAESPRFRAGLLWTAVLGSNLPDFDILMRPFVGEAGLGYLLHHRGYTHTLLLSIPLALLAACMGRIASRRDTPKGALLFLTGWMSVLVHVIADFWNDYGVHPFWPFENRWFYGDFVFIVEPLIWLGLLPFVFQISRSKAGKAAALVLASAMLGLAWLSGLTSLGVATFITFWALVWTGVNRRTRGALSCPALALVLVLSSFAWGAREVRQRVKSALPPGESLLDLVTTPAPGNPLCWRILLMSREGEAYYARLGVMGVNPSSCHLRVEAKRSAPITPLLLNQSGTLLSLPSSHWVGEFRGNLGELKALEASHCRIRAFLRFSRAPFWVQRANGSVLAGDLRFDREEGLGFAEIESQPGENCYDFEPAWHAPAFDWLKLNVD